nr:hypothetical protein [Tanacetum cinerariifolium]
MWEVEPRKRHRHMIIELDYPLLEANEAILFSKLTIDVCGSKQEEALKWETHDKVIADFNDHHIVIEASCYQIMSFKDHGLGKTTSGELISYRSGSTLQLLCVPVRKEKVLENSFKVLKVLENSLEVFKVPENNLKSLKLQEN